MNNLGGVIQSNYNTRQLQVDAARNLLFTVRQCDLQEMGLDTLLTEADHHHHHPAADGADGAKRRPWIRPEIRVEFISEGTAAAANTIDDGHLDNLLSPS